MFKHMVSLCALSTIFLFSCQNANTNKGAAAVSENSGQTFKVAVVNIDSMSSHLEFYKENLVKFEAEEKRLNAELERMAKNIETEYAALSKKANEGNLSPYDGEKGQQKIAQMQQNLEQRRNALGTELMTKQASFNAELKARLDKVLADINKEKKYNLILSDGAGSQILYFDQVMDITQEVMLKMNEIKPDAVHNLNKALDTAKK